MAAQEISSTESQISVTPGSVDYRFSWTIPDFLHLVETSPNKHFVMSPDFKVSIVDRDGKITSADGKLLCFPKGLGVDASGYVSLYLFLSKIELVLPVTINAKVEIKSGGTLGLSILKDCQYISRDFAPFTLGFPKLFPLDDMANHPGKYLSDSGKLDIECILTLEPVSAVPSPNSAGMRRVSDSSLSLRRRSASMRTLWTWDTTRQGSGSGSACRSPLI
jgi:hypothetical protein